MALPYGQSRRASGGGGWSSHVAEPVSEPFNPPPGMTQQTTPPGMPPPRMTQKITHMGFKEDIPPETMMSKASPWARAKHWAAPEGPYHPGEAALALGLMATPEGMMMKGEKFAVSRLERLIAKHADEGMDFISNSIFKELSAKAASGKIVKGMNTRKAKLLSGWLTKVTKGMKNPFVIIGMIGSYAWATQMSLNERGDAATALQIAMNDVEKSGDLAAMEELNAMLTDITDPSIMNTLKVIAPIINYPLADITKWKATKLSSDKMLEAMRKKQEKEEEEERPWAEVYPETMEEERQKRHEFNIKEGKQRTHEFMIRQDIKREQEEEMRKYYEDKLAREQASEKQKQEFWARYQANKQAFWEEYQKKKEEEKPSKLGFGLL
jgi:hypothetical protein